MFSFFLAIVKTTLIRIRLSSFVYKTIVVCSLKITRFAKIIIIARVTKTTIIAKTLIVAKKYLNQERKNNF